MHLGKIKQWGPVQNFDIESSSSVSSKLKPNKSGNSRLGELVLQWLRDYLEERGPRHGAAGQGKTYENLDGKGGYGNEKRV